MAISTNNALSNQQSEELLRILNARFDGHKFRHKELEWDIIAAKLKTNSHKLWSLYQMEITGGEPDVVVYDKILDQYTFFDCAVESPMERRSLCYDRKAMESRKANKPKGNAMDMASDMGIQLLTESQYRQLQTFGDFDTKTSSWLNTPPEIRQLGGAIFGNFRFDTIFIYHNGAESYYSGRGFRGVLNI